jgi:competence protein ComEC
MRGCQSSLFATAVSIEGVTGSPWRALADLRARIGDVLHRAAPGDTGVLLSGLVTGDDEGFSAAREDAFVNSATKHLTAVSGSNLALVAGICATVGAATVGRHRIAWQVASIAAIWGYALISGLQAPAIRAAIVTTGAILAFRIGRRPDFVTLIALAAGAMVLIEPRQIEGLGFRLSVAASLALAIVLPGLVERGRGGAAAGIVAATAAAQVATLPFLLPIFGTVSLLGLPANVIVAPFVAMAMPIAFCGALLGLIAPGLGEVIVAPAALAATATLAIVDVFGVATTSVRVGTPPFAAALVIAATCACLLLVLGGGVAATSFKRRGWWRDLAMGHEERAGPSGHPAAPPALASAPPVSEGD